MNATAALAAPSVSARPCPAWCEHGESHGSQLHQGYVHEVGDLLLNLYQDFGDNFAMIGIADTADQEIFLNPDEAEQVAMILLRLVRAARRA
jgi:hypothetical protein